ncbi:Multidrug resistance ABC transporter ATP-binding/permease protein BmrA [Clavibacter michiganensis]|nr:Multidrug resistance ABC transporter ATP-binding/permease protein BmrA [Clavibacter michiganensis]
MSPRATSADGASGEGRGRLRDLAPYFAEHRRVLGVAVAISVLSAAASLAQPVLVGRVIEIVQGGGRVGWAAAALIALVALSAALNAVQHYLLQRTGTSIVLSARRRLVRRMFRLPVSEYDTRRTGDLVSRVGSDTTLLHSVVTQGLVNAVGGTLVIAGAIIAMLALDAVLLGATAAIVTIAITAVLLLSGRLRVASREQQDRVGDLAAAVERGLGGIRTIRAADATDAESRAVERHAEGAWESGIRLARISALVVPVADVAIQLSLLVVLGLGGYRVASGLLSVADLIAFVLFLFLLVIPLGEAFAGINSVNQGLGALGRIQQIIDLPEETHRDEDLRATALQPVETDDAIRFDDVGFAYGQGGVDPATADERMVLDRISFGARIGRRTALVGPSGAGKSTILTLIERFHDPTEGAVRLHGRDLRSIGRDELRRQIGYVEQESPVLAGTVRENLLISAPDASDDECRAVLASVNLLGLVDGSAGGLDAQVGEDGVRLSGGERQRLAIARALLAAPPILLLDESTSALDSTNERLLRTAIDAVADGRTLIVIAHRLSTVVDADRIIVLDRGRIVGSGTHAELILSTPLYRDLARHQLLA